MIVEIFSSPLLRKLLFAAVIAVVAIAVFRSWLTAHNDRLQMQAAIAAQNQLVAEAAERERQRAQDLQHQLAQIAALKRQAATPQQILRELPHYLPLPQPIQLAPQQPGSPSEPSTNAARQQGSALPEKPSAHDVSPVLTNGPSAQIPVEDLKPLFDYVQDCRACQAKLAAAQADLRDERAKVTTLSRQRDAAQKAAKGGGFWARTSRAAKWLVIGGLVGYALAKH